MSTIALDNVLQHLTGVRANGKGYKALCPAHDDRQPSLSVDLGKDNCVLLHCHAGCATTDVAMAAGLTMADLFERRRDSNGKGRLVESYAYTDEEADLLYWVHRYANPKDFRQQAANGAWSMEGVRRVLYHLPEAMRAKVDGRVIFVVEGEKDADAINAVGMRTGIGTCGPGGAGKWRSEFTEMLVDAKRVAVVADDDEPGRRHAATGGQLPGGPGGRPPGPLAPGGQRRVRSPRRSPPS